MRKILSFDEIRLFEAGNLWHKEQYIKITSNKQPR
jgi:hypothetical protein